MQEEVFDLDYEELPANTPLWLSMAAGSIAGIMEHTVMFPVDAIKTRMQVAGAGEAYKGLLSSISAVTSSEGTFALWRGVVSVVLGSGPAHALHFAIYETITSLGQKNGHASTPSTRVSALAGAAATITSDAFMTPFDVIKQRMQLQSGNTNLLRAASQIWRNEGISAFYVSYPITIMMNIPFTAINFAVYDNVSHMLNPQRRSDPLAHCLSGGIAGATAAAVSTPFDVIKTLLQTRGATTDAKARSLNSVKEAAKYIYQQRGLMGFTVGMKPRVLFNMPSTAICWTVYETAKFYISSATQGSPSTVLAN
ncbi:Fe(2+) transporter [Starmerella bacillaris]|uniref:Fe(2+) transporter n=1 Tax=Starmerella bacillaris TaxID=1247836 RepID=A0AAV5RN07_STABA|nr:Fe(2+) transporter [Starmerella bacillaris]